MSKATIVLRATPNLRYVATMQQVRRSSASTPHDPRPNRQRSRADARRQAIRESRG